MISFPVRRERLPCGARGGWLHGEGGRRDLQPAPRQEERDSKGSGPGSLLVGYVPVLDPMGAAPEQELRTETGGEGLEERGEVCLAEEVEHLRQLGLSDGEVASELGVDVSWVESLISPDDDEPDV